ncbi:hypothetical protein BKA70DRAFT_282691 [Coprinopsis sp. MPI-PUGE-AT-0042]|nr:hypothetical protein BKA70DRAFT_282691 [Coprinopsis sp. MPI-PUGE-AT-0042]
MGKGGKGKLKTYKPPPEKFVVVYKAWGINPSNAKVTCNQIAAWFEVMLRERYPDTRPYSIYYQPKKLHYFIVELPSNVDINPYLGTHSYDAFLKGIQTSPNDVACLYEYNYKSFGDPSKVWNQGFAEYTKIPEGFPVRSPYPIPGPAVPPPGDLPSAIYPPRMPALPPQIPANPPPVPEPPSGILDSSVASSSRNLQAPETSSIPQAVEPDRQRSPTSSLTPPLAPEEEREQGPPTEVSTFQPYEPPNHYQKPTSPSPTPTPGSPIPSSSEVTPGLSTKLQKWDPYEEEEAAEALLRSSTLNDDGVTNDNDLKSEAGG